MLRRITRAELDEAYKGGSAGLYVAALFGNPNLSISPELIDDQSIPREIHALACLMFLTTDSSQDGVEALIERFGHLRAFRDGVERLGWPELDRRLAGFLALMEPYADDQEWWERLNELTDAGAFDSFKRWFWDQELELDRRVEEFVRKNEAALFVVV